MSGPRRRLHPLVLLTGAVVLFNLAVLGLDRIAGGPEGPRSSSYATAPDGVAAFAELVARGGHEVNRLRTAPAQDPPASDATAVLLDPAGLSAADARALRAFIEEGGRLILGGRPDPRWLTDVVPLAPTWAGGGVADAHLLAPTADVGGARALRAAGEGYWADAGGTLPVFGRGFKTVVSVASVGSGRAVLLADATVLHNRLLDEADNAAFAVAAAGSPERPVVFLEGSRHGGSGLGALPGEWKLALSGTGIAAGVLLWAYGRRLGPPERPTRLLPPPRVDYVRSLGAILARTNDPAGASAPLRADAIGRLARRAGLGPEPNDEELWAAARRIGMPEGLAGAVVEGAHTPADVITVGRANAWLQGKSVDP